jgi:hypothetical protein
MKMEVACGWQKGAEGVGKRNILDAPSILISPIAIHAFFVVAVAELGVFFAEELVQDVPVALEFVVRDGETAGGADFGLCVSILGRHSRRCEEKGRMMLRPRNTW